MNLSIDIQEREHHSIIFVQGEVDVYTAEQLKKVAHTTNGGNGKSCGSKFGWGALYG